jgi:hypothetical protein
MSEAMIMRPFAPQVPHYVVRRQGLGDPITDAMNTLATSLTQQTRAQIDDARLQVLTEVDKQAKQAKIIAVAGGFVAGLVGAFVIHKIMK